MPGGLVDGPGHLFMGGAMNKGKIINTGAWIDLLILIVLVVSAPVLLWVVLWVWNAIYYM